MRRPTSNCTDSTYRKRLWVVPKLVVDDMTVGVSLTNLSTHTIDLLYRRSTGICSMLYRYEILVNINCWAQIRLLTHTPRAQTTVPPIQRFQLLKVRYRYFAS